MSTRSGVVISVTKIIGSATDTPKEVTNAKHLYHHHDGYLQGVGAKLIDLLQSTSFSLNIDHSISCSEFPRSFQDDEDIFNHGDLEYYYAVSVVKDKIVITAYKRQNWHDDFSNWLSKVIFEGHLVGDRFDKSVVTDKIDLTDNDWRTRE